MSSRETDPNMDWGMPKSLGATGDPKGEAGAAKPGLSNISPVAQFYEGAVMEQGAETYGAYNWAEHGMKASTYYNAMLRHLNQWWLGEDWDGKSKFPHMAHLRASTGIILDQQAAGRMIDDRPKHLAPLAPVFDRIMEVKHPMLKVGPMTEEYERRKATVERDEKLPHEPPIPQEPIQDMSWVEDSLPDDEPPGPPSPPRIPPRRVG